MDTRPILDRATTATLLETLPKLKRLFGPDICYIAHDSKANQDLCRLLSGYHEMGYVFALETPIQDLDERISHFERAISEAEEIERILQNPNSKPEDVKKIPLGKPKEMIEIYDRLIQAMALLPLLREVRKLGMRYTGLCSAEMGKLQQKLGTYDFIKLQTQRDLDMARNLHRLICETDGKVIAVFGPGHAKGINEKLASIEPECMQRLRSWYLFSNSIVLGKRFQTINQIGQIRDKSIKDERIIEEKAVKNGQLREEWLGQKVRAVDCRTRRLHEELFPMSQTSLGTATAAIETKKTPKA